MAAAAGIFNHQLTAGQVLTGKAVTPMGSSTTETSSTSSSDDSSSGSATISANDFLTLLVTEMQNQDPTADTDPNEYINQLVQVNSLEQLIDINQTLSTALGGTTSASGENASAQTANSVSSPEVEATSSPNASAALAGSPLSPVGNTASSASVSQNSSIARISGNLSIPTAIPAAQRVAHALNGRTRAATVQGSSPANQ